MALKSYVGKGAPHYSVKRRLEQLNAAVNKLAAEDPNFKNTFVPATTKEEFDALYNKYAVESAEFTDIKEDSNNVVTTKEEKKENPLKENADTGNIVKDDSYYNDEEIVEDQFNHDDFGSKNVNTREYVLDTPAENNQNSNGGEPIQEDYAEPVAWHDKFAIPKEEGKDIHAEEVDEDGFAKDTPGGSGSSQKQGGGSGPKKEKERPFNPAADDMSGSTAKRRAKRNAKTIVDVVCALSEHTFMFFINKSISHERLMELQNEGVIDLDFMVQMENGHWQKLRAFFAGQRAFAEQQSKISEDQRNALIEDLVDVLLDKGIVLTPLQQLGMTGVSIIFEQGLKGMQIVAYNESVIKDVSERLQGQAPQPQQTSTQEADDSQNDIGAQTENMDQEGYQQFEPDENLDEQLLDSQGEISSTGLSVV